jgi:putative SOS response-associated peptidase YedK
MLTPQHLRLIARNAAAAARSADLVRQLRCLLILSDYFEWRQAQTLLRDIIREAKPDSIAPRPRRTA